MTAHTTAATTNFVAVVTMLRKRACGRLVPATPVAAKFDVRCAAQAALCTAPSLAAGHADAHGRSLSGRFDRRGRIGNWRGGTRGQVGRRLNDFRHVGTLASAMSVPTPTPPRQSRTWIAYKVAAGLGHIESSDMNAAITAPAEAYGVDPKRVSSSKSARHDQEQNLECSSSPGCST
jgi:hypothetical protein